MIKESERAKADTEDQRSFLGGVSSDYIHEGMKYIELATLISSVRIEGQSIVERESLMAEKSALQ